VNTILIVGGRLKTVLKAKELGLRVVLMQHKERLVPGQAEAADALLMVDYTDWPTTRAMAKAARDVYGFEHVVSLVEQGTEPVGRINDFLELRGTSYAVAHLFKDKLAMRRRLKETGTGTVAAELVGDAGALREFGRRHGYPFIVKPVDGTGSRGVLRVDAGDDVDAAWRRSQSLRGRMDLFMAKFYPIDQFIAETYIDGPEYSVETLSFGGRHVVVAITEKLTFGVVEIGHAQPARLEPDREIAIVEYVTKFLDAMGLRDGTAHTELKLSSAGPRVIESHDRVGGDRIMDLVESVYGVDLERYAVGWPFGLVPALPDRPAPRCAAATRFLSAPPGKVVGIEGVDDARAHEGVIDIDLSVKQGDTVAPVTENADRIGQILTTAASTAGAVALCDSLAQRIRVVTRADAV